MSDSGGRELDGECRDISVYLTRVSFHWRSMCNSINVTVAIYLCVDGAKLSACVDITHPPRYPRGHPLCPAPSVRPHTLILPAPQPSHNFINAKQTHACSFRADAGSKVFDVVAFAPGSLKLHFRISSVAGGPSQVGGTSRHGQMFGVFA